MILLALKTGLRHGELIGLQWSDVDLQCGKLQVRRSIRQGGRGCPRVAGGGRWTCPAWWWTHSKGHRHLRAPYVFSQPDGQPLTASMTEHRLSRAVSRAGISREQGRITWHDLRHTYGSQLAMRGCPAQGHPGADGPRHYLSK